MKIFSQKFIGVFTLLLTSSLIVNAQGPCDELADYYIGMLNELQAFSSCDRKMGLKSIILAAILNQKRRLFLET